MPSKAKVPHWKRHFFGAVSFLPLAGPGFRKFSAIHLVWTRTSVIASLVSKIKSTVMDDELLSTNCAAALRSPPEPGLLSSDVAIVTFSVTGLN